MNDAVLTVRKRYDHIPDDLYEQYQSKIQDAAEWLETQITARGIAPSVFRSVFSRNATHSRNVEKSK